MDTVVIGGPFTGKTVKNTGYQTIVDGRRYSLFTINEFPVCYCPKQVSSKSALKELLWVYAKIPWSSGKLFIGGVANGDKMEYDINIIEMYSPKPFTPIIEKYLISARPKIHKYNLQEYIIDGTVFLFYSLESLSLSDIIQLLVKNYADKRN